jgi:hypothetical protein
MFFLQHDSGKMKHQLSQNAVEKERAAAYLDKSWIASLKRSQ